MRYFCSQKNNAMTTLLIAKIDDQGDRVLFYGHPKWDDYHVIAPAGTSAKIGDKVEYQPEGYNFGWFVRIVA